MKTKLLRKISVGLFCFIFLLYTVILFNFYISKNNFNNLSNKVYGESSSQAIIDKNNVNFTNLIIFARFSDEDEFIDTKYDNISVKNLIDNTYSNSEYAVSKFFYSASNGKVKMQNLYLFSNNGSIQLSKPRGYYAEKDDFNPDGYETGDANYRMYELKQDWSNAVNNAFSNGSQPTDINGNAYSISDLDKNNDGKIDAITIIYKNATQNISVSWSSPLWNYQDSCYDVSISSNGKTYESDKYVQLTFTYENSEKTLIYTDSKGIQFLNQSTACHETSHIFGLKDLYRSSLDSQIYYMSLMGKHISPVCQYMSIKEREAMNWVDSTQIKTLSKQGSYTLDVISSDISTDKILGYKLDLPNLSKTLYLEYRKFDGSQNIFDTKEKIIYMSDNSLLKGITIKSGLVCYLANSNMKIPNNLGTTGSNWNFVALGGQYSTKSDCAVGLYESLDITDTLYVEVEEISDTQLTFSIYGDELIDTQPSVTHNMQHFDRIESTCYSTGNIEYYYCADCQKYFADYDANQEIFAQEIIIPKKEHSPTTLYGIAPTCTQDGLTDGVICSVCNEILESQTTINKLGHLPSDWLIDTEATTEHNGVKHKECTRCQEILDTKIIEKLPEIINDDKDASTIITTNKSNLFPIIISISTISLIAVCVTCFVFIKKSKRKRKKRNRIILK